MINTIETFVREHMLIHLVLIALSVASLLGAMVVDLIAGVRKAKDIQEKKFTDDGKKIPVTTSTGLKKTAIKANKYFSPFSVLVFIDLICCIIIPFPVFSMAWAAYCIFCEFTSVREKSWQKAELRKAEKTMNIVIENKDELAKVVASVLFEHDKTKGGTNENSN